MKYVDMPGGSVNGTGVPTGWSGIESLIAPELWVRDAACAEIGGDVFFPEQGGDVTSPRRICAACPVIDECLEFGLRTEAQYGIYGGKTARELLNIRMGRRAA